MSEPFKVGDRVAVYDNGVRRTGKIVSLVAQVDNPNTVIFHADYKEFGPYQSCPHIKQCRRLVKRERRRVWTMWNRKTNRWVGGCAVEPQTEADRDCEWLEFIEVRPKK